jgi:predicted nucleotidyltransferase
LCELLDERHITNAVDEPIDAAVSSFKHHNTEPLSLESFHGLISEFVAHLYERGLRCPQILNPQQALAEALSILERSYQNGNSLGYTGAALDGTEPASNCVDYVLFSIAEAIKCRQRANYSMWVFAKHLDPTDWENKIRIADLLFELARPFLPPRLLQFTSAELVDDIPNLIRCHLDTETMMRKILAGAYQTLSY